MRSLIFGCAIVIILNCSSIAAHWYGKNYNSYSDTKPHDGKETGCNLERGMQISRQMKEVRCMPRYTLVKLTPQLGFTFYPNYALVKRCSGFCYRSQSCIPVAANFTQVTVRMYGYNTKQCYNVLVEEHAQCKCKCSVEQKHCNIYQQYSEDNCTCECMNRMDCDKSRNMLWDENTCKCICSKDSEQDCSSGLEWVQSRCRCAKIMEEYEEK